MSQAVAIPSPRRPFTGRLVAIASALALLVALAVSATLLVLALGDGDEPTRRAPAAEVVPAGAGDFTQDQCEWALDQRC